MTKTGCHQIIKKVFLVELRGNMCRTEVPHLSSEAGATMPLIGRQKRLCFDMVKSIFTLCCFMLTCSICTLLLYYNLHFSPEKLLKLKARSF